MPRSIQQINPQDEVDMKRLQILGAFKNTSDFAWDAGVTHQFANSFFIAGRPLNGATHYFRLSEPLQRKSDLLHVLGFQGEILKTYRLVEDNFEVVSQNQESAPQPTSSSQSSPW
jgi:hypothetical protein